MTDVALAEAEKCPRGHQLSGIGIVCPERGCRGFILFADSVYSDRKALSVRATFLVLATMAALLLSRFADHTWPLYIYLTVGVILLYATVFSRGRTLGPATWILTFIAAAWLLWYLSSRLVDLSLGEGLAAQLALRLLPPVGWVAFTVYMYRLGLKQALSAISKPATYFLIAGAFTFGFWGVWLFLLEVDMVSTLLYQLAIGFGLLLPLLCVGLLIWQARGAQAPVQPSDSAEPSGDVEPAGDARWDHLALWLVVSATFLVLIEPMIQALAFLLGRFVPLAAGHAPLADITVSWLGGPGWRALLTSILLMIAATLVAVRSFVEVTEEEREESALAAADTGSLSPPADTDMVTAAMKEAGQSLKELGQGGTFYGKIGLRFATKVLATAHRVINVAVPVVVFSVISLLLVLVLSVFQDYRDHGPFFAAIALWGTGLTTWIVVVVMCGVAFESAPYQQKGVGKRLIETGAASMLGGLMYFLVSLVSAALLPLWLTPRDSSSAIDGFTPGEIYIANLVISMSALLSLVLLTLAFKRRYDKRQDPARRTLSKKERRISYSVAAVVLLSLGVGAFYFAVPPIQVAAAYVSSPYDTSTENALRSEIPATLVPTCTRDQMLLTDYQAGLHCQSAKDNAQVTYHLFSTEAQLNQWYAQATRNRGITADNGNCATSTTAEGSYSRGRFACYTDRSGSWLLWTDAPARLLGIARNPDKTSAGLHALWSNGSLTAESN